MGPNYGVSHMVMPIHFAYGRCKVRNMATIGERIRDRRKALKLRQGDLAALVGLDQSTISDIERGQGFGADVLMRFCGALRADPYSIMNGNEGSRSEGEHSDTRKEDGGYSGKEMISGVKESDDNRPAIPTSMNYSALNLKSAILLMGNLIGVLDKRSKKMVGELLRDLADDPDDALDIAEKAAALATTQKPITKNKALNKALRGKGEEAVETGPAPLEH